MLFHFLLDQKNQQQFRFLIQPKVPDPDPQYRYCLQQSFCNGKMFIKNCITSLSLLDALSLLLFLLFLLFFFLPLSLSDPELLAGDDIEDDDKDDEDFRLRFLLFSPCPFSASLSAPFSFSPRLDPAASFLISSSRMPLLAFSKAMAIFSSGGMTGAAASVPPSPLPSFFSSSSRWRRRRSISSSSSTSSSMSISRSMSLSLFSAPSFLPSFLSSLSPRSRLSPPPRPLSRS